MSWSASFVKPVPKAEADTAIDNLTTHGPLEGPAFDQLRSAKSAAKAIIAIIPGPYITVSLSGHANGVGWQKKDGMANDCITVNVGQITEDDMKYYTSK